MPHLQHRKQANLATWWNKMFCGDQNNYHTLHLSPLNQTWIPFIQDLTLNRSGLKCHPAGQQRCSLKTSLTFDILPFHCVVPPYLTLALLHPTCFSYQVVSLWLQIVPHQCYSDDVANCYNNTWSLHIKSHADTEGHCAFDSKKGWNDSLNKSSNLITKIPQGKSHASRLHLIPCKILRSAWMVISVCTMRLLPLSSYTVTLNYGQRQKKHPPYALSSSDGTTGNVYVTLTKASNLN